MVSKRSISQSSSQPNESSNNVVSGTSSSNVDSSLTTNSLDSCSTTNNDLIDIIKGNEALENVILQLAIKHKVAGQLKMFHMAAILHQVNDMRGKGLVDYQVVQRPIQRQVTQLTPSHVFKYLSAYVDLNVCDVIEDNEEWSENSEIGFQLLPESDFSDILAEIANERGSTGASVKNEDFATTPPPSSSNSPSSTTLNNTSSSHQDSSNIGGNVVGVSKKRSTRSMGGSFAVSASKRKR